MSQRMSYSICYTIDDVNKIVSKIKYRDLEIKAFPVNNGAWKIGFDAVEKCNYTGDLIKITVISNNVQKLMCKSSDVIRAIMEIVLWWECHEAFERFEYEGTMLLDPHSKFNDTPLKSHVYEGGACAAIFDSVKNNVNLAH